jgi:hypothetical protein
VCTADGRDIVCSLEECCLYCISAPSGAPGKSDCRGDSIVEASTPGPTTQGAWVVSSITARSAQRLLGLCLCGCAVCCRSASLLGVDLLSLAAAAATAVRQAEPQRGAPLPPDSFWFGVNVLVRHWPYWELGEPEPSPRSVEYPPVWWNPPRLEPYPRFLPCWARSRGQTGLMRLFPSGRVPTVWWDPPRLEPSPRLSPCWARSRGHIGQMRLFPSGRVPTVWWDPPLLEPSPLLSPCWVRSRGHMGRCRRDSSHPQ